MNSLITKTQLLDTLSPLPENFNLDQIVDRLIFVEKIQNGLNDSNSDQINIEEAKQKLKRW